VDTKRSNGLSSTSYPCTKILNIWRGGGNGSVVNSDDEFTCLRGSVNRNLVELRSVLPAKESIVMCVRFLITDMSDGDMVRILLVPEN
jgi:hypothetical protein